jgi:SAM-dependent methyltransferase/ribosomal protein S18 acetylase RimI-like enzyme
MEGNGIRSSDGGSRRWDAALQPLLGAPTGALWRLHSDAVNATLFARWLPTEACADLLKTDLFDEAMGSGLYPLLSERARRVAALDLAPSVLAAATMRHPALLAVAADVRRLPFASDAFDFVVSNSTLDHFDTRDEILASLRGFHRVLRPGGHLLLTMDNLANPAVALRNALPYRLLHRLKLVAYPIGATGGPGRLRRMLNDAGFDVLETVALLHCPRALSVALARRCERRGTPEATARFLRTALRWERLARWPTRYLTGYFVGIHAKAMISDGHSDERQPLPADKTAGAPPRSAYPAGNFIRRALLTLRDEGLKSFWFKLLSQCGYRRLLLLERALDQPVADFAPGLPVDVAMLAQDELDDYLVFRPGTTRREIAGRLRSGHLCFVARHEGRIVAAAWIAMQPVWVPFLGCRIDVTPDEAHIYDKFTLPAYRGHGISNAVRAHHLKHLQRAGLRRATGAVLPENVSSLRDDTKGGFRVYGVLGRIKLGPWQRVFLLPSPRGRS